VQCCSCLVFFQRDTRTACDSPDTTDREVYEERRKQYDETLLETAMGNQWPGILTDYLDAKDPGTTRDVLDILVNLKLFSSEILAAVSKIENFLPYFKQQAEVYGETESGDNYFTDIVRLCEHVLNLS